MQIEFLDTFELELTGEELHQAHIALANNPEPRSAEADALIRRVITDGRWEPRKPGYRERIAEYERIEGSRWEAKFQEFYAKVWAETITVRLPSSHRETWKLALSRAKNGKLGNHLSFAGIPQNFGGLNLRQIAQPINPPRAQPKGINTKICERVHTKVLAAEKKPSRLPEDLLPTAARESRERSESSDDVLEMMGVEAESSTGEAK